MNFLEAAEEILQKSGMPLHYREITSRAIEQRIISTEGKTPWATMNARIAMDIVGKGEGSTFMRTVPGFYGLNSNRKRLVSKTLKIKYSIGLHHINEALTTKQKGDIGEARVAELITLYGEEGLSCYRPISDDEGIDLIVKKRKKLEVVYVQIKTTFGNGLAESKGFVSTIKESKIENKARSLLIFAYFDLSRGDLYDNVFCIPSPEFLKLTENEKRKNQSRVFSVGLKNPDKSKFAEFMIEKGELANRISEIMDKL